jgi:DNA-binding transcriptional regulator YiaG
LLKFRLGLNEGLIGERMEKEKLIQKAQDLDKRMKLQKERAAYIKTMAWFHYLGLLRHTTIEPHRHRVTLLEVLEAADIEPRILELLPAVLTILPDAIVYKNKDMPKDLADVMKRIRTRNEAREFRGVPARKYLHWLSAPIMDVAKRRINYRELPRHRLTRTHSIGEVIRDGRYSLALTQQQFANTYGVSLRVIRDLEQGKLDASLKAVNDILAVFGRKLSA